MSLIPCFFSDFFVLREPGYNVAYWNLHERSIEKRNDNYLVNDKPLYFFHFSGIDPNDLGNISKYQNRFRTDDISGLREILETYKSFLRENEHDETVRWPYHYGFLKNGAKISDFLRAIYWGFGADSHEFGNPFNTSWSKIIRFRNLPLLFSERFLRAMANRLFMYLWKLSLKRRRH
jgi:hypothetical protein